MPNDLSKNPLIIDTAGTDVLVSGDLQIATLRWISVSAAAGDQLLVTDANNRTFWESRAGGLNNVEAHNFHPTILVGGLRVPTLDSGVLYIYLATPRPFQ